MLYSRIRRFKIAKELRKPVGVILSEITKPPQKRNKTDVYWNGVRDGVELVRERANDMGISLEEPYIEVPVVMALVEVSAHPKRATKGEK